MAIRIRIRIREVDLPLIDIQGARRFSRVRLLLHEVVEKCLMILNQ
jgi:hypothetical protein